MSALNEVNYANVVPLYPVSTWPGYHVKVQNSGGRLNTTVAGSYIPETDLTYEWLLPETLLGTELDLDQAAVVKTFGAHAFYAYGYPSSWSANTECTPPPHPWARR